MESWIERGVNTLRRGGTILYPTDTIWGLGCDAANARAVTQLYTLKQRSEAKSMLVLVSSTAMLCRYVAPVPPLALQLIESASKPLTIIYPRANGLASNLLAEDGSVGIRIVHHALCQQLIEGLGGALVSTSANVSGQAYGGSFGAIPQSLKQGVDLTFPMAFDTSTATSGSRIVKLSADGSEYTILRD